MDFMKMLQQAQEFQKNSARLQEELQAMTITGMAGGGMVTAEVTGQGHLKRLRLDSGLVNPHDIEMLEDLVVVAVADAQKRAQEAAQAHMSKMLGGMDLPFKLPF